MINIRDKESMLFFWVCGWVVFFVGFINEKFVVGEEIVVKRM